VPTSSKAIPGHLDDVLIATLLMFGLRELTMAAGDTELRREVDAAPEAAAGGHRWPFDDALTGLPTGIISHPTGDA